MEDPSKRIPCQYIQIVYKIYLILLMINVIATPLNRESVNYTSVPAIAGVIMGISKAKLFRELDLQSLPLQSKSTV